MKVKLVHQYRDVVDSWDESPFRNVEESHIDESAHTIRNVCVFGTRHSKNGYDYENPAIDKLTTLTEGAKFFINHPSKSETKDRDGVRDIRDWAGVYSAPKKYGEDKVFADLKVRPAFWELVRDVAIMKPPGIGNSINSRVKVFKDQIGKEHVVDIENLRSIDLVASAATTSNLFESHGGEKMKIDEITIEQLINENQKETQNEGIYQLITNMREGLLLDKIKERETARQVSELQWKAGDSIEDILRDKDKDMKNKKMEISLVLDDLESMINDVLSGKKSPIAKENKKKEDDQMEFGKITLEDLSKERPDIIKSIKDSIKVSAEMEVIKKEHGEMKIQLEALAKERDLMKTQLEALAKERDELKKKEDEYEIKEKGVKKESLINEKVAELKIPKDVMTDVFKTSLMIMEEKEMIEALNDRKAIFFKGQKVVKGAGDEYIMPKAESDGDFGEKKNKAVSNLKSVLNRA
jgi:hypothetical protein